MKLADIPFHTTDWAGVERTEHPGEAGMAYWQTLRLGELRTELEDGRTCVLTPGMSYQVADGMEAHRSSTATGARLFIVD